jgi:hypothetical protein
VAAGTSAGAAPTYTSCATLSGLDLAGQTDVLGGCSAPTGGSGTFTGPLASPVTVSWAGGGTTTLSFATKTLKKSKCGPGTTEMYLHGKANASTGPAQSIRGMFYAQVCVDANENLSVVPGKAVLLQS